MEMKSVSLGPCVLLYYRALESAVDWNVQDTDGAYEWLITGDVVHSHPVTTPRCVQLDVNDDLSLCVWYI